MHDVLIIMQNGPSTPKRLAAPFYIATLLASFDAKVKIILTGEAALLATGDIACNIKVQEQGQNVLYFITQAYNAGVEICVCTSLNGITKADLIKEVIEITGGQIAEAILESSKIITL